MGYLQDIWDWIGNLKQGQKFDGFPDSVDQYLGRETGGGQTGIRTPLELDILGIRGVVDSKINPAILSGIYNRSNGRINVDSLEYLISIIDDLYNDGVLTNCKNITEQVVLDAKKKIYDDSTNNTKTFTVGAGKFWVILSASTVNDTRAAEIQVLIDDGSSNHYIGGRKGSVAESPSTADIRYPVVADATWTVTITDLLWQAGDANIHSLEVLEFG